LFAQQNEHRIVVGRIALLADVSFFRGRSISLLIEIYLVQLFMVALFTWMCRYLSGLRGRALVTVAGLFCYCMFSVTQIENFNWGIQITQVFAGLGAAASFACVVWHAKRSAEGNAGVISWPLAAAFLAALLAEFSLADGLLAWPIILWMCYILRFNKRTQFVSLLAGVMAWGIYFIGYVSPVYHPNPWLTIRRPLSLAKFVTTYFASSWDATLPSFSP